MPFDGTDLVLFGAAFAAALVSGLAGFAFALVAAGAFLQFLPPTTAVPIVLAGSAVAQLFSVVALRRAIVWPRLRPFVVGGLLGLPFGIYLLTAIEPSGFRLLVGAFPVAYSLYALAAPKPDFSRAYAFAADAFPRCHPVGKFCDSLPACLQRRVLPGQRAHAVRDARRIL